MARKRIPVVGPSQLNTAQLSPEERRILAHRSREAARREYAPVIQADRGAYGTANAEYRAEAQSARGATNAVEDTLAQALAGLKTSGLSGRYLQQAKSEFTSRAADAASALPALLAGAGEERAKAIGETRQKILEDKAAMQQSGAAKLNQELKEQRTAASSVLKAQKEGSEPDESTQRSLQNATIALKGFLANWAKNIPVKKEVGGVKEEVPIQQAFPLKSIDEWRTVAEELDSSQAGFDLVDAMTVINRLLKNRSSAMHKGRLPQPGVPYGPRQTGY